ncbi:MAG: chorismate--pyruvate lyase family protein [Candidatus Helarchaeota archaeon]
MTKQKTSTNNLILPIKEAELSPLHRILLHTNGTVTQVLRQWTGSFINIVKPALNSCFLWDKLEKNHLYYKLDSVNHSCREFKYREVILQCVKTGTNLVYALSLICHLNLTPTILHKLDHSDLGIGMIIEAEKLETYREILAFKKFKVKDFSFFQKIFPRAKNYILHRCYVIYHKKKPCFIINEYFPSEPEHFDFQVAISDKKRILNYPKESFE